MPSIYLIRPVSDAASSWIDEHVQPEPWQWLGGALAVEHRYIDALVEGMEADGLVRGEDFRVEA